MLILICFVVYRVSVFIQETLPLSHAYALASDTMYQNLMAQPDAYEGINAFLGKRHPHWMADSHQANSNNNGDRKL